MLTTFIFTVFGIDRVGVRQAYHIRNAMNIRVFQVTGKMGVCTVNNFYGSRVVAEKPYHHVYRSKLSSLAASIQASHQQKMFEMAGADLESKEAYQLALEGMIRPIRSDIPVIYGIKVIEFRRPFFTLEIVSVNETEDYLAQLVHEMAFSLKTFAHVVKLRCVRHGAFGIDSSLTREHWNLQSIMDNMAFCNKTLRENPEMLKPTSRTIIPYS